MPDWLDAAAQYAWRWLLLCVALAGVLWLVAKLRLILIPCVAALIMATVLVPPYRLLRAKGLPRLPATLVVFLVPSLLLYLLARTAGPGLIDQFDQLGPALAQAIERAQDWISDRLPDLQTESARVEARLREQLTRNSSEILSGLVAGASMAIEAVAGILLTLTLLFFFVKDGDILAGAVLRPLPPRLGRQLRTVGPIVWSTLTSYVRGVVIIGAVNGVAVGLALLILDVPLVVPLMVLTFLGAFFPLVGAVLAGVAAVLVALVSQGVADALILAGVVLVVQQLEGDLVAPLVFSKAVNLHPVAVLTALTTGVVVAGAIGAVLAVPVAASIASSFTALRRARIEVAGKEGLTSPRSTAEGGSSPPDPAA
ncbi:MAG TPA: AI-2E family transporter [Actinomycetota bacterium]|nr:AI-2E family transporter [Actinomycetota bacterium]